MAALTDAGRRRSDPPLKNDNYGVILQVDNSDVN